MRFDELRLAEPIVRAVAAEGYTNPTPIQEQAIPPALAGKDVLGCAQTGTGKTGAFALPILHRLADPASQNGQATPNGTRNGTRTGRRGGHAKRQRSNKPRALILCPTRELATQIYESFNAYGRNLPLRHAVIFGGVSQGRQVQALRDGIDVVVATPGRLLDLLDQGVVDLGSIEVLVLDEADRMLDMGFIRDIRKIVQHLPQRRQTLLFSATMPEEIRRLADSLLHRPVSVQATPEASTVEAICQSVYLVTRKNKPVLLERLLRHQDTGRTLVFTRTKYGADKLVRILRRSGIEAGAIHGNKNQNARTRALDGFKSGGTPVLVATDIASRGIDVDEITHVVNYDMPNIAETYVHRIGRTARAGASGVAVSFCDHDEIEHLRAIERLIRMQVRVRDDKPDLTYDVPITPTRNGHQPSRNGTGTGSGNPRRRASRPRGGRSSRPKVTAGSNGRSRRRG